MPTETRSEDAQHWIEPLSQLDVLLESERTMYGEATARRGRARKTTARNMVTSETEWFLALGRSEFGQ